MARITVVGSSAIDLVVVSDKRPIKGETIIGKSFNTVPGGKGANQAVAAARLGAEVKMIGAVGQDAFGNEIMENFNMNKVDTEAINVTDEVETGTAHITLAEGDNSIIVVKGANDSITPEYIQEHEDILKNSDMVLIQQEIPKETVEAVINFCFDAGVKVLLNPAPARPVSLDLLEKVDYVTPNEHEAEILFQTKDIREALKKYPNKALITEGAAGVRYFDGEKEVLVPGYKVEVVDTTGAGDTFNGALAVALAEGKSLEESIRFGNRAASLSVTGFGAQGGMPIRETVEEAM
ncbi:MAG: ribokinase [Turicibacter sp.]|nr:ribokinase [Turicibacter sp.]